VSQHSSGLDIICCSCVTEMRGMHCLADEVWRWLSDMQNAQCFWICAVYIM